MNVCDHTLLRCKSVALSICLLTVGSWLFAADSRLADATEKSDRAVTRALLKQRADVNAPQADGMTALHWAAYRDDLETAKLLVEAKASVTVTNRYGVTPLSLACQNGCAPIVELLLERGADHVAPSSSEIRRYGRQSSSPRLTSVKHASLPLASRSNDTLISRDLASPAKSTRG